MNDQSGGDGVQGMTGWLHARHTALTARNTELAERNAELAAETAGLREELGRTRAALHFLAAGPGPCQSLDEVAGRRAARALGTSPRPAGGFSGLGAALAAALLLVFPHAPQQAPPRVTTVHHSHSGRRACWPLTSRPGGAVPV